MVRAITLHPTDDSVSATIPRDLAESLHLVAGDRVLAVETEHGLLLTPAHPDIEGGLAIAGRTAKKFRNALRELAK